MRNAIQKTLKWLPLMSVMGALLIPIALQGAVFADPASTQITCVGQNGNTHKVTATKDLAAPKDVLNEKDFKKACTNENKNWTYQASTPSTDPTNPTDNQSEIGGSCQDVNVTASNCDLVGKYLQPFINFLAALVGVAVVISIIVGGIQYSSSAGDPSKVSAAKKRIFNAIVALITFLFLYALLNFLVPGGLV